jgi:hypothetical protein
MRRIFCISIAILMTAALMLPMAACATGANNPAASNGTPQGSQSQQSNQNQSNSNPSGQTTPGGSIASGQSTGHIEFYMTDAPVKDKTVTSVNITISALEIHVVQNVKQDSIQSDNKTKTDNSQNQAGKPSDNKTAGKPDDKGSSQSSDNNSWIKISISKTTFDLLKLKGVTQLFASADMATGKYTQLRLVVDNATVGFSDGTSQIATVPSGELKFNDSFDVVAGKTTVLTFDFDAEKSVNITGSNSVMIKPVVKMSVKQK